MKALIAALLVAGVAQAGQPAPPLTFAEIVARVQRAHPIPTIADDAPLRTLPTIRAETAITRGSNADIFTTSVFRADAITTLLSVDYPLGVHDTESRLAKLDVAAFRERRREAADALFRDTVDAVALLYAAQEKLKVLRGGLERVTHLRERANQLVAQHEISNVVATQWEEQAIAAESQMLDLELQRLDAEMRVKQLMGDVTAEPIEVVIDLEEPLIRPPATFSPRGGEKDNTGLALVPRSGERDNRGLALAPPRGERVAEGRVRGDDDGISRAQLLLEQAEAARRPQVLMSAFGGFGTVGDGPHYGLYGLRVSLTLPSFDAAAKRRLAEAKLNAQEAAIARDERSERERREQANLELAASAAKKRIDLLQRATASARQREEAVIRLASAGVRSEHAVTEAAFERTRRESELLAARIELWKAEQLLGQQR